VRRYLAAAAILAYFLFWVFRGTYTYLNPDDVTAIYRSLEVSFGTIVKGVVFFWSGELRPLGALFYRSIYELAGVHALPFRYASLALLILNLLLQLRFLDALTKSKEIVVLAVFFDCFHGELWDIFSSSGGIFDVLCYTFYIALLGYYVAIRARGELPSLRQVAVLCLLTALALDSKEMGATIPILLVCYEAIFHSGPGFLRNCRAAVATGFVVLAFLIGWFFTTTVNTGNPAYAPALTVERYLLTTRVYLTHLFAGAVQFTELEAVSFLMLALLLGVWMRSKFMVFGWVFYIVTLLPMSFVPPRQTGYALYLPIVGCALYLAALFVGLMDRLSLRPAWRTACCGLFLAMAAYSHYRENQYLVKVNAGPGGHQQTRELVDDFRRLYPSMPKGARILLVDDPFQNLLWQPFFTLRLLYRDFSLQIYRTPIPGPVASEDSVYDLVLEWRNGHYVPR
jgi:hypothetical protein